MNWNSLLALALLVGGVVAQTTTEPTTTPTTTTTTTTTTPTTTPITTPTPITTGTTVTSTYTSRTTHCPRSTHHHRPCCPHKCGPPKPCCETITKYTRINECECCILVHPCPTNTTVLLTTTVTVAPTVEAVAPVSLVVPSCTPCTSYVTTTVHPPLVCTTMIFCDVADQGENCRQQNELEIERIVQEGLRSGGQVFVNGQRVVFEPGTASTTVTSSTSLLTMTGMNINDASTSNVGLTLASLLGGLVAGFLFI